MNSTSPEEHQPGTDPSTWVDAHGDALFRYALLRVRDNAVAEDLVQECLLAALSARERFQGQSSERTWLTGILKRKIIDHYRRSARTETTGGQEAVEDAQDAMFTERGHWKSKPSGWSGDPESLAVSEEFWSVFRHCLAGLPSRLADSFTLRELEEVGSEEVCKVLDLTPTNLWSQLHRARLRLRQCLEHNWFKRKA